MFKKIFDKYEDEIIGIIKIATVLAIIFAVILIGTALQWLFDLSGATGYADLPSYR